MEIKIRKELFTIANQKSTVEGKASRKNGVKRMIFALISIALEILVIFLFVTHLSAGNIALAEAILRILAVSLVLRIYGENKTSAMKMPWIILILVMPFVGVGMYLLVGLNGGTKRMMKRYEEVDKILVPFLNATSHDEKVFQELKKTDPSAAGISDYLRKRSYYPVWQNTDVVYYDDASDGLEAQLIELAKARKFIFMEYHAIEDRTSWGRIEDVLAERAAAGVEVRVFYDDMGSIGFINTDFVKKLENRGIRCRVFNPMVPGLNMFLNNRDHRKITVVDGRVGFTGGYNLADEYFNLTHPFGQWKDTGIRLEGEAVRSLTSIFLEMWNAGIEKPKEGEQDTDFGKYLPLIPYTASQKGYIQPYADIPMGEDKIGEDVYISMVEKAEKYCYFVTPYLIITDEMTHAINLAAKRGVDVRIVTPGIPDKKMVYSVTRSFYGALVRSGVRVYEWSPGFVHCKMSVVDDKMCTVGTINLDYRSLYHHFENGCWIYDETISKEVRADFDQMFRQSREVTRQYMKEKGFFKSIPQLFLRLFAELM